MKIVYIMSRFPLLSETFILREMDMVEAQGGEISLYPLICQDQNVTHAETAKWMSRRNCFPFISAEIILTAFTTFIKNPIKLISLFVSIVYWNLPSLKFFSRALVLFPKALLMAKRISEEEVDLIHAHYASHPALAAYIISSLTGIPYSLTIHSHDIYDNHVMLKQKLGKAKFLVTISEYNVSYLNDLLGPEIAQKASVIHCGVDPDNFAPLLRKDKKEREKFEVLQIGSLHWKKGQITLIQSIKILKDRIPKLSVQIIGEGPERLSLEKAIIDNQLEDIVTLMGAQPQEMVREILPTADCYVQSSVSEGIPVALMEALACELPVVATNITGIPEIIQHNETGLLVPPDDPQAIADAIYYYWINPEDGYKHGAKGRELVEREFNLAENVSTLTTKFMDFLNQK